MPQPIDIGSLMHFMHQLEVLKKELRHGWLSNGQQESVAEHVFRMAMIALVMAPHVSFKMNVEKVLTMILVHDLPEIITGDQAFHTQRPEASQNKKEQEHAALIQLLSPLPEQTKNSWIALWQEFEDLQTPEARFVKALDDIESQLQHNEADLSTWLPIEYGYIYSKLRYAEVDPLTEAVKLAIQREAEQKIAHAKQELNA